MSQNANSGAIAICRASIALHSKSFSLAAKLLPRRCRDDASILYAWCRHADDAIDEAPRAQQAQKLAQLKAELAEVYRGGKLDSPMLAAFQGLVTRRKIPRTYPAELLGGMAMDVEDKSYSDMEELALYCYRVASTVGLMMCHITGLSQERAMRQAAHLGMAMQLTNICRDVLEDWQRGRLYLPDSLLDKHGAGGLRGFLGGPFPVELIGPTASAVEALLGHADTYYRSADRGLRALPWRVAFGVRAARLVYSDIGRKLRAKGCDITAGRAVVSTPRKLVLVSKAAVFALAELPSRGLRLLTPTSAHTTPRTRIEFSNDLLCN